MFTHLNTQREFLNNRLREIDKEENHIRAQHGMELINIKAPKRHRITQVEVDEIRNAILHSIPVDTWVSMAGIVDSVALLNMGHDDDTIRLQIRALEKDTESAVFNNGKHGRASLYCIISENGMVPDEPVKEDKSANIKPESLESLVVKAFKSLRSQGKVLVKPETIMDSLFEHEVFASWPIAKLLEFVAGVEGVKSNGKTDDDEVFCFIG